MHLFFPRPLHAVVGAREPAESSVMHMAAADVGILEMLAYNYI